MTGWLHGVIVQIRKKDAQFSCTVVGRILANSILPSLPRALSCGKAVQGNFRLITVLSLHQGTTYYPEQTRKPNITKACSWTNAYGLILKTGQVPGQQQWYSQTKHTLTTERAWCNMEARNNCAGKLKQQRYEIVKTRCTVATFYANITALENLRTYSSERRGALKCNG